jgi:cytochrome oxidase Cu insertion factor (SCO1/SenC/PrrC family)
MGRIWKTEPIKESTMRIARTLAAVVLSLTAVGCAGSPSPPQSSNVPPVDVETPTTTPPAAGEQEVADGIFTMELEDVVSGESFTLASLKGKPILLHPFAVW